MKRSILPFCLFIALTIHAQETRQFYNWQWKPCDASLARFFSLGQQTDSGWFRRDYYLGTKKLQMKGLYADSACKKSTGCFTWYYTNGNVSKTGNYRNGEKNGLWLSFAYNGMLTDSTVYADGRITGTSMGWYSNGYVQDSCVYKEDRSGVEVSWFDNGNPSSAGITMQGKKEGKWRYFHKNGNSAALEEYRQDKLISRIYYDETGKPLTDTANKDREAEFKGGMERWKKFLENNLEFPGNVKLVNTDIITVVINALIDEEGNVLDAYVDIPFNPLFDKEALRVVKKSPKWQPAISHNRRVRMYIRQPVSFSQEE